VEISLDIHQNGDLEVLIQDDGPGFSAEALQSYGERQISRKIETQGSGRVSVGLGSVVMKTISQAHRGTITVSNRVDSATNQVLGASVKITLPGQS
jgi:K+-sensing histidine kinase KdpD